MTELEHEHVRRRHGKWSVSGVPHKGWNCIDVEDLGSPGETCEMCEYQIIRYVHVMTHAKYPRELRVGCVCAGHMEEDLRAARDREQTKRNESNRRTNWLSLKGWKISRNGNPYINKDDFNVVVYRTSNGLWRGRITRKITDETQSTRRYRTEEAAKLAAFDIKCRWEQNRNDDPFEF